MITPSTATSISACSGFPDSSFTISPVSPDSFSNLDPIPDQDIADGLVGAAEKIVNQDIADGLVEAAEKIANQNIRDGFVTIVEDQGNLDFTGFLVPLVLERESKKRTTSKDSNFSQELGQGQKPSKKQRIDNSQGPKL